MNRRTFSRTMLATTATAIALPGALRAQTPAASPAASDGIRWAKVEGTPLALSPDGMMLAGVMDDERFGVWDTETFETIARSQPMEELRLLDAPSVSWSPDSSAVAWSLMAAVQLRDSDIYILDVDSGEITNITDDEPTDMDAAKLPIGEVPADFQPLNVDVQPSWTADGESLVFARTVWGGDSDGGTSLMRISRDGGEATEIEQLSAETPFLTSSIKAGMDDGGVLYATWPPAPDSPEQGVFVVTPDGEVEILSTGLLIRSTPSMLILGIAPEARKASLVSAPNHATFDNAMGPIWIEMDLDTGIPTAFEEVLGLPTDYQDAIAADMILLGAPAFLTDGEGDLTGYLYATTNADYDTFTLWRRRQNLDTASGEAESLGTITRDEAEPRPVRHYDRIEIGANGTAAIFHGGNAWLTSIEV